MTKIKAILKVSLHDDRSKKKAMVIVAGMRDMAGVDTVLMDMKEQKITITGDVDPVVVACKLRKLCQTKIVQLQEIKPTAESNKPEEKKNECCDHFNACDLVRAYHSCGHPPPVTHFNYYHCPEEYPNACVIC